MALSQALLDSLILAYASGALEVRYGDKRIIYKSREDLEAAIRYVKRSLNQPKGASILSGGSIVFDKGTWGPGTAGSIEGIEDE